MLFAVRMTVGLLSALKVLPLESFESKLSGWPANTAISNPLRVSHEELLEGSV